MIATRFHVLFDSGTLSYNSPKSHLNSSVLNSSTLFLFHCKVSAVNSSQDNDSENFEYEQEVTAEDRARSQVFLKRTFLAVFCVVLVASLALITQHFLSQEKVVQQEVVIPEYRPEVQTPLPEILLEDITTSAGIDFVFENGATGQKLLPETMGGGCAFADMNGDLSPDLILINSNRWPWDAEKSEQATPVAPLVSLYLNNGFGEFTNVSENWGLTERAYGMGCSAADYDNDGDLDLYVTTVGKNRLLRNEGEKFTDVTETMKVGGREEDWSTASGWFDYDRDGDLDLLVCQYVEWSREIDLSQDFQLTGVGRAYGRPQNFGGAFPTLYRNDGDSFTDVTDTSGLKITNPATGVPLAKSLGILFEDFNHDGWLDVMISNDTVQNLLFLNQQNGEFLEEATIAGVAFDMQGNARGAMGIDAARFRNDDSLGVAIGNFANEMTALYVAEDQSVAFTDQAISCGLGPQTRLQLTFGVLFGDFDLDGRVDLFAANGHLESEINVVQASQQYQQSPQLFWNAGDDQETEFRPLTEEQLGSAFLTPMVGRGASTADIDADGDLDLLIATSDGSPRLLRNNQQTGHHWLQVRLEGRRSNRNAIGAFVTVKTPEQTLYRRVSPTRSYLSQVDYTLHFGLGQSDGPVDITIDWPNGDQIEMPQVPVDQLLEVIEPEDPA